MFFLNREDSTEALFEAVRKGNLNYVKTNIGILTDINAVNKRGESLLHVAAREGRYEIANFLLESGINPNVVNPNGGVMGVIPAAADSNSGDFQKEGAGETPLHLAADFNHEDIVLLLLKHGADTEISDYYFHTPLYRTIFPGYTHIAKLLLEAGANAKARSGFMGGTLLHEAANYGEVGIMKALLEHGAEINSDFGKYSEAETPLHVAVRHKRIDAVRFLIEKKALTWIIDKNGKTALQYSGYDNWDELLYWGFDSIMRRISNTCNII